MVTAHERGVGDGRTHQILTMISARPFSEVAVTFQQPREGKRTPIGIGPGSPSDVGLRVACPMAADPTAVTATDGGFSLEVHSGRLA